MPKNEKETEALKGLLTSVNYHYDEFLENTCFLRCGKFSADDFNKNVVGNEYTVSDFYIFFALMVLNVADALTIHRFLYERKKRYPKLAINVSFRFITKRIRTLVKRGVLGKVMYVQNTDNTIDDAYEALKKIIEEREKADEELEKIALEDIIYDDEDDLEGDVMDNLYSYSDIQKEMNKGRVLNNGNSFLVEQGIDLNFKAFFGKDAVRITLYYLSEPVIPYVLSYFGGKVPATPLKGYPAMPLSVLMGMASCSSITTAFCQFKDFNSFEYGNIRGKTINFIPPYQMSFVTNKNSSGSKKYFCSIYPAYIYVNPLKMDENIAKTGLNYKIKCIKNYIGILALGRHEMQDAFVIVCVNDLNDAKMFAEACFELGITEAELDRLYFMSESLIINNLSNRALQVIRKKGEIDFVSSVLPVK